MKLNTALILLDRALEEIDRGFVLCEECGDQEPTKDLDFVDDLKSLKVELLKLTKESKMPEIEKDLIKLSDRCVHQSTGEEYVITEDNTIFDVLRYLQKISSKSELELFVSQLDKE